MEEKQLLSGFTFVRPSLWIQTRASSPCTVLSHGTSCMLSCGLRSCHVKPNTDEQQKDGLVNLCWGGPCKWNLSTKPYKWWRSLRKSEVSYIYSEVLSASLACHGTGYVFKGHGLNCLGFGVLLNAESREVISRTHAATDNLHGSTVAIRQMLAVCMHTLGLLIASQLGRLSQCSLDVGSGDATCVLGLCYERSSSNRGKIPRWCWKNTLPVFGIESLSVQSSEGAMLPRSFAMW